MWLSESGGKNPKSVWWADEIKAAVRTKEAAWKEVSAAGNKDAKKKENAWGLTEKKRERLKGV